MATTPNMNLLLPDPTITPGPTYASENDTAFFVVDQHDHTLGKGVPIPSNAININNDLPFNGFNAVSLRSTRYTAQSAPLSLPADLNAIYSVNGNLYWNNQIGQQVQITSGASLNASSIGGIGGDYVGSGALEFYTSADKTFTFWSSTNVPANLDAGSVTIRNITSGSFGITLGSNGTIPANYSIQLPPDNTSGTPSFLTYDTSNNITVGPAITGGITGTNVATNTLTLTNFTPRTIVLAPTAGSVGQIVRSGSITASTTSIAATTLATLTLTTNGGPVMIRMGGFPMGSGGVQSALYISGLTGGGEGSVVFDNITTSLAVAIHTVTSETAGAQLNFPASGFSAFDYTVIGSPGTYTYTVSISNTAGGNTIGVASVEITVWEMF